MSLAEASLQIVHSLMEAAGHVVHGGLESGQHALLLSSSRESTWEPITDRRKEDGSHHCRLIEQLEHPPAYMEWPHALLMHNLCEGVPLQLVDLTYTM